MASACLAAAAAAPADAPLELSVKATYLVKLGAFVDWPPRALPAPESPFAICVAGHDSFGSLLDRAAAGQRIGDHPVVVRRMGAVSADPPCQILFIGGSRAQSVRDGLKLAGDAPVLTVTDGASSRGVIDFALDQGRVRFRIDDAAAAVHGLTIRAQLLNLALSVTPRSGGR